MNTKHIASLKAKARKAKGERADTSDKPVLDVSVSRQTDMTKQRLLVLNMGADTTELLPRQATGFARKGGGGNHANNVIDFDTAMFVIENQDAILEEIEKTDDRINSGTQEFYDVNSKTNMT